MVDEIYFIIKLIRIYITELHKELKAISLLSLVNKNYKIKYKKNIKLIIK